MPDFSERLDRICNTLSEQIDSLSAIATEFSDFALMPQPSVEKINLADVIESSVALFKDIQNIHIVLEFDTDAVYEIKADRQHMVRVFNNLIKNAVQAIGRETEGNIRISIKQSENQYITEVTDDGPGIPEDQANKIFSPSFTTKSSGMGLGLAIVQSIIMEAGGEISFTSEPGNGASFLIVLPLIQDHKAEGQ